MKNALLLLVFLFAFNYTSSSQIVVDNGLCFNNATFELVGTTNGKNHYNFFRANLYWDGSRWVIEIPRGVIYYNISETAIDPPCFGEGGWILNPDFASECGPLTGLEGSCGDIPIPTLSQWGIIFLGLILLIFGIVVVRQKMVQTAKLRG